MQQTNLREFQELVRTHEGPMDLLVGPDVMSWVLEARAGNDRALNNHKIGVYVADMAAGRWRSIGDPITFTKEGVRTNGQHRAEAVRRYNKPVAMPFRFGAEGDVYALHDSGLTRNAKSLLEAEGVSKPHQVSATCYGLYMLDRGTNMTFEQSHEYRTNVLAIYRKNRLHIEWFMSATARCRAARSALEVGSLAAPWVYARPLYEDNPRLDELLRRYASGDGFEEEDPIRLLRDYAMMGRRRSATAHYDSSTADRFQATYDLALRAIRHGMEKRKLKKLQQSRARAAREDFNELRVLKGITLW